MTRPTAILLHTNDGLLTVARALVRRGVRVHMLVDETSAHLLRSRGVTGVALPDPRADPDAWLAELDTLGAAGGGVLLCGSDATSELVARHRTRLPASLLAFESADDAHLTVMDKLQLYRIAAEIGVRAPWMHHVADHDHLKALLPGLTYPCVLKGVLGHNARAVLGHGTVQINDADQLTGLARQLLAHDVDFLLTEVVPGPETALEGTVTIRAADGTYPLEYSRRKIRQWPPGYGVGSVMESRLLPETLTMNRLLLDHVGFVGVAACETKRHSGTGELYLIEVNVRVPNGFGLADACGVDGSWRLYAAAAGLPLPPQPPQVDGRRAVFPELEFRAARAHIRGGTQSLSQVLSSYRGARDFGVLSLRDPAPALTLLGRWLRDRVARRLRGAGPAARRDSGARHGART